MQKKILILYLLIFLCLTSQAQKEAYNWVFGEKNGLTWNTTRSHPAASSVRMYGTGSLPTVLPAQLPGNIAMRTYEGCFALSDENGNLLFYSDGNTIYNSSHTAMINGTDLGGNPSSAQSGVLMPYPGRPNIYIAISIGLRGYNSLKYAIVNPATNTVESKGSITGYSGDVGESLNVIRHSNKKDFWIVAPSYSGSNTTVTFNSWLVTQDGIQTNNPVKTPAPAASSNLYSTRYFKFSPNGKHFAWAAQSAADIYIGEFDASNGEFEDIKRRKVYWPAESGNPTDAGIPPYSLEFSKSGNYLYVSGSSYLVGIDFKDMMLNQTGFKHKYYKMNISDTTAKATVMAGSLQLAPDGYIYATWYNFAYQPEESFPLLNPLKGTRKHMLVITNPEQYNNLTIWRLENFIANGGHLGITSFSPSWFSIQIKGPTDLCSGLGTGPSATYSIELAGTSTERPATLHWYWDKLSSPTSYEIRNVSAGETTINMPHEFAATNTRRKYTIELQAFNSSGTLMEELTQTLEVTIYPEAKATADPITTCANTSALLVPTTVSEGATVTWYEEETGGTALTPLSENIASTGILTGNKTFYMQVDNPACSAPSRIAVPVTVEATTTPTIATWPICAGEKASFLVSGISDNAVVKWYDTETGTQVLGEGASFTSPDPLNANKSFYAEITGSTCSTVSGRIKIDAKVNPLPTVTVSPPQAICAGNLISVTGTPSTDAVLRWYTSENAVVPDATGNTFAPIDPLYSSTRFFVEAYNPLTECTSERKAVDIVVNPLPELNITGQIICPGEQANLVVETGDQVLVVWYDVPSGGTAIRTGKTYTTEILIKNKTLYLEAYDSISGCSTSRIEVNVVVEDCPSNYLPVNPHLRSNYK